MVINKHRLQFGELKVDIGEMLRLGFDYRPDGLLVEEGTGSAHRHTPGALATSTQLITVVQSTVCLNTSIAPRMSKGPT